MGMTGLKFYKPITPGFRGRVVTSRRELWKGGPFKPLTVGLRKQGGRDSAGHISVRHQGGGHRRLYRLVDLKRVAGRGGVVERIEYDPNRSANIALLRLHEHVWQGAAGEDAERQGPAPQRERFAYMLASEGLRPGTRVESGAEAPVLPGNTLPLQNIPAGMQVHNVELYPGRGGQLARAAGAFASIVRKGEDGYTVLRLPSGEQHLVLSRCLATVGAVGNAQRKNEKMGKAGAARWRGIRPTVRGMAMNAVDHPHGGGRGKSKGRISQSKWGVPSKGFRTRSTKRTDWAIRLSRHKLAQRG